MSNNQTKGISERLCRQPKLYVCLFKFPTAEIKNSSKLLENKVFNRNRQCALQYICNCEYMATHIPLFQIY